MVFKKPDQKNFVLFVVCSSVTIGLVLLGWFFSFRDTWRALHFSLDGIERVSEIKNDIQKIGSDFKDEAQTPANEIGNIILENANELREEHEKQEAAKQQVGELMKKELLESEQ